MPEGEQKRRMDLSRSDALSASISAAFDPQSVASAEWFWESPLFSAMTSLNLHERIVSMGFDGKITFGHAADTTEIHGLSAHFAPRRLDQQGTAVANEQQQQQQQPWLSRKPFDKHSSCMRAILWRIFLRVLPFPYASTSLDYVFQQWCESLYEKRAWYSGQKQSVIDCAMKSETVSAMLSLSLTETEFFNKHDKHIIMVDLKRSYPGPIITEASPTDIRAHQLFVRRVFFLLLVWTTVHKEIGYRQGMHEIAATCCQVLRDGIEQAAALESPQQQLQVSRGSERWSGYFDPGQLLCASAAISECFNAHFAEADAFFLFDGIMQHFGLVNLFDDGDATCAPEQQLLPAEKVFDHIFNGILKHRCPILFQHFVIQELVSSPWLYLARWVRNLFIREVSQPQCLVLWDGIFAASYDEHMSALVEAGSIVAPPSALSGRAGLRYSLSLSIPSTDDSSPPTLLARTDSYWRYAGRNVGAKSPLPPGTDGTRRSGGSDQSFRSSFEHQRSPAKEEAPWSRTLCGIAVAIHIFLKSELLCVSDTFTILQLLTRSPVLPLTVDPYALLYTGMLLADSVPEFFAASLVKGSPAADPNAERDAMFWKFRCDAMAAHIYRLGGRLALAVDSLEALTAKLSAPACETIDKEPPKRQDTQPAVPDNQSGSVPNASGSSHNAKSALFDQSPAMRLSLHELRRIRSEIITLPF